MYFLDGISYHKKLLTSAVWIADGYIGVDGVFLEGVILAVRLESIGYVTFKSHSTGTDYH